MSLPFHNKTGNTKFKGEFTIDGLTYEYILYLLPAQGRISPVQKREIVHSFGNRTYKGNICLGIDMNTIRGYINSKNVSAFVRVNPVGIDNEASGTLQIFNHCGSPYGMPDIWINDVCRVGQSREGNPVYALFVLMEQLAAQNMNKTNMKLYVEREPTNLAVLKEKYEQLGFVRNADEHTDVCPGWHHDELVMEKTGLIPRPDLIDFSFLSGASQSNYDSIPRKKRRTTYGGKTRKNRRRRTRKAKF